MTQSAVLQELHAQLARHRGRDGRTERRRSALAALEKVGLPNSRRESWRYTDLKLVLGRSLDFVPAPPDAAVIAAARARLEETALGLSGPRLVLVDGHPVEELSNLPASAIERAADGVADETATEERAAAHPLAALNAALEQHETVLRVPAGRQLEAPLEIVLLGSARAELAPQPRVIVDVGADSELVIVQHLVDCDASAHWINSVVRIVQAPRSRVRFYRLQEHGAQQSHTALLDARLHAGAELSVAYVDLGGQLVRNDLDVALVEEGAAVEMVGVFLAAAGQHVDEHTRIDHIGPKTRSDETFRGIIGNRGHGVFNGKVVVHRTGHGTDARQSNDNLLLGEHGEIDTKPELEIYADDVKCSHGSTVGELDADQLFYMRSRGLEENDARSLLTAAFARSVLERIEPEPLREAIVARVTRRLDQIAQATS